MVRQTFLAGVILDIQIADFNGAAALFAGPLQQRWTEVQDTLRDTPPHFKVSDQAGKQGSFIFDPKGTNFTIKQRLSQLAWAPNVRMPDQLDFLGTDVDFVKDGVVVEVQFSNYPFLLNNTVRAELLYKSKALMSGMSVEAIIIITKAGMFPASNSTLYYEQAFEQLSELSRNRILDIPIRLVGLFPPLGQVDAIFTGYHTARYSRTVVDQGSQRAMIANVRGKCLVTLV